MGSKAKPSSPGASYRLDPAILDALAAGTYGDPFALLGMHGSGKKKRWIRTLQPGAAEVHVVDADGESLATMKRVHDGGVYQCKVSAKHRDYRLRVVLDDGSSADIEDPYRFPSALGEMDLYLLGEGSHQRIYQTLGAHRCEVQGVGGTRFAVWAPNALRVSVVGEFNHWDGRSHVMRCHPGTGVWEMFVPGVDVGTHYKYELLDSLGRLLPLKSDPMANRCEAPPGNASIVHHSEYQWSDDDWMEQRRNALGLDYPVSIYEVHLSSWRKHADGSRLSYRELAEQLVQYVKELGFTHIELLPVTEHPFDGSWGYQPVGLFAPTHRFGEPDDFRYFVDCCHQAGISVIMDWVPAHFPKDPNGLGRFDGTALYEHDDPRKGEHVDWGTLIFNYGRREVVNYLIGSALYWIEEFHIDALRVDAVASMLYLDYSREDGEWIPNEQGGNENLEAIAFLRRLNEEVHARGAATYAEESTAWPSVSRPTYAGGLGFTYKWNMGWMNDTLRYMQEDPVHRQYHHDLMTFGLVYAFHENFVLPLSHDEVVHGKGSLLERMPGDDWQRFANLRAYLGTMFAHPGKKLLFMGAEIAQSGEWNHDQSLDWHLLEYEPHAGVQRLVRDLNRVYCDHASLHQVDFDGGGFEWIDWDDRSQSVLSWIRRDRDGSPVICVSNMTPVVRENYRLGVDTEGPYRELINTDLAVYGGSDVSNGSLVATAEPAQHRPCSLNLVLPPLATLLLAPAGD